MICKGTTKISPSVNLLVKQTLKAPQNNLFKNGSCSKTCKASTCKSRATDWRATRAYDNACQRRWQTLFSSEFCCMQSGNNCDFNGMSAKKFRIRIANKFSFYSVIPTYHHLHQFWFSNKVGKYFWNSKNATLHRFCAQLRTF